MEDAPIRQITDSRVLAAMAHPLRRRILDVLRVDGPATASALAERTGQAVGNISHHVKVLAECALVQQAPELARDRRERWWQLVPGGTRWRSSDFGGDAASEAIERAATSLVLDRQLGYVRAWDDAPQEQRSAWPEGPFTTQTWLRLTDDELSEFGAEVIALSHRWGERTAPDDGRERKPVLFFARAVPAAP